MLENLTRLVPLDAIKIAAVLVLSSFIGLEREEHKQREAQYAFGGIRTFPLIGLFSYALALVSGPGLVPWTVGLALIGGLMIVSYLHKLTTAETAGITTELSALATYLIGALVQREQFWIAGTIAVLSLLLLELKTALEGLATRVEPNEILTAAKFLLLTVVILPIVPNQELTRFHLNPFKTWLVVVAVSGVSFFSYLLQRAFSGRGGVFLSGILGGAYSSTATTVVLARQSKEQPNADLFSGSILAASGMMYARLTILVAFFNLALAAKIAPGFAALALVAVGVGWLVSRTSGGAQSSEQHQLPANPLQLKVAFLLALAFVVITVMTNLARDYLGRVGLYSLAIVIGAVDVDPFVLGLAQSKSTEVALGTAASAILIAASSNNVAKAIYAYSLADRATGRRSLMMLCALAALGFLPLAWL
jgi:uncharacterized membrane protein (DUF4010 family)